MSPDDRGAPPGDRRCPWARRRAITDAPGRRRTIFNDRGRQRMSPDDPGRRPANLARDLGTRV